MTIRPYSFYCYINKHLSPIVVKEVFQVTASKKKTVYDY